MTLIDIINMQIICRWCNWLHII